MKKTNILTLLFVLLNSCISKEQITDTKLKLHNLNLAQALLDSELVKVADSVKSGKLTDDMKLIARLQSIGTSKLENIGKLDSLSDYLEWQEYYAK